MIKKIILIFFSLKLVSSLALLVYDLATPGSYVEIAGEDWFLSSMRLLLLVSVIFFAFLIYGIYSGRRWVMPLYSVALVLLIFATGYICYNLYYIELFSISSVGAIALTALCAPILIWLGLYRVSGEI